MGSILRYNLFENAAARFLLGAVHVPINRILIPLFIRAYLLRAVRLLLFEDWRVIDKAHRATIGGDHGGLVHVVCGHLLLHKLESVSRNSVWRGVALHQGNTILQFAAGRKIKYFLRVHNIRYDIMLCVYKGGRIYLLAASPLLLFHDAIDADAVYLRFVILLWSRLNLTMVNESCTLHDVTTITPRQAVDHKLPVTSTTLLLLLLLNVCYLKLRKAIPILAFAVHPNWAWINLIDCTLSLRQKLTLNLDHLTTHVFAAIHLLLLGKCHNLSHWHL